MNNLCLINIVREKSGTKPSNNSEQTNQHTDPTKELTIKYILAAHFLSELRGKAMGVNFALYADNATEVELCLFKRMDRILVLPPHLLKNKALLFIDL